MKNYAIIIACFCILFSVFGCKPEVKKEATVSKVTATAIHLSDGTKIDFPKKEEGKTVMFVVRPGKTDDRTGIIKDLNDEGRAYAERLKELLKEVDISSVLAIGTNFAQNTGRPLADAKGTKVYTFNNVDYGPFLDYVYRIELGKKFMVVDLENKIPELLYTFTAGQTFDSVPPGAYNELFVVFSSKRGAATVHRLKF